MHCGFGWKRLAAQAAPELIERCASVGLVRAAEEGARRLSRFGDLGLDRRRWL
jgi:hypothetical protein